MQPFKIFLQALSFCVYTNLSAKTAVLDLQDGGSMLLKNVGNHPQDFAVQQCVNLRSLFSGTET
jgi:hypothetical protein